MLWSAHNGYGGLLMLVIDIKLNEGLVIGYEPPMPIVKISPILKR